MDISTSLTAVLKKHPQMAPEEAMWTVTKVMLANNPYEPPSNGKCPINELPTEILGHIFKLGVEMEEDEYEGDDWEDISDEDNYDTDLDDQSMCSSTSSSYIINTCQEDGKQILFQVLVSHVCRHWREVALNSHVLWTRLKFEGTLRLDPAKVFIDRARGLPLDIYVDCVIPEDIDQPDHPLYDQDRATRNQDKDLVSFLSQNDLVQILDLIEPELSHWGELEFHVSTHGYSQCLFSRLHNLSSAPLLKNFHVYHHGDNEIEFFGGDDKTKYLPFHGNAPLLESAIFWGVHIDWDNSLHFLQGLHNFELSFHAKDVRPSYTTFIQIIKNSPDLRCLSLSLSGPALATGAQFDEEGQWGREPFEILSVEYLTLQFHEPQYAIALIQHFYFPKLRGLTLNFDEEDYSSFVRKLLVPVKGRSKSIFSGLESLKISGLPCDVATVEAMLQQLTELKVLYLKCFGPEEQVILKKLINPSAGRKKKEGPQVDAVAQGLPKIYCPVLETLTISIVRGSQIKALVIARELAGAPLKTLRLSQEDDITAKTAKWLRDHVEQVEFFEPSDSEDEVEVDDEDDDGDDSVDDDDDDDDDDDEEDDDDDEDDPTLGNDGVPLPSPIAHHLRRTRAGRSDLD